MFSLPDWTLLGIFIVGLFPANLLYDVTWGLVDRSRIKWYLTETLADTTMTFVFILGAVALGFQDEAVAALGMAGCFCSKNASMVIVGSKGLFTSEPQKVPEWWVYVATYAIGPIFLLDSAGPIVAYMLQSGL